MIHRLVPLALLSLTTLTLAAEPPAPISLFDGKTLGKWEAVRFGGEGNVWIDEATGDLRLDQGEPLTAVVWKGEVPATSNYEISLEAKKVNGDDFFLALTLPVKDSHCTFVCGGWGGGLVGISSINGMDASENETASVESFENGVWYPVKVRVTDRFITCWIGGREVVSLNYEGAKIDMRPGDIEMCVPLGLATYQTWAAYRNFRWTNLPKNN
ncbi:MAG: hypothetical protein DVB23_002061 [Verrucomicrobia bacterium]|jgi:hypothetical protein|nr:MAG: hypothetical protein DVB23_002061 [Verrucomicrobiota bacterium]